MDAPIEKLYAIEVVPQWIKDHPVDFAYEHDSGSPFYYLLTDYQDYVDRERTFSYTRTVQKINDASRLEDASLLVSELNEKHQRVFFHHVVIIRGDKRINALDPENIAVYQRETSLESHIVTGRKTVALTIDDLRVGDILDVQMTFCNFASTHPLHGKSYLSTFWLAWQCPVVSQYVRVINAGHTDLLMQYGGASQTLGEVKRLDAGAEFYQHWQNLAPMARGQYMPAWVWSDFLQFTTANTWPEVSRHLYAYYEANGVLDTQIDMHNIDLLELTGEHETDLLRIVRFVQNNVRYRGENHGIYTHTPKTPERTLKKRAGDCKDKSNLMVALLRRIGVAATLVLVNSRVGEKIAGLNPSAYQFDHMIVKVETGGKTVYFDPTIQAQAGDIEHSAQLSYGFGLELTAEGKDLCRLPFDLTRTVFELVHEYDFAEYRTNALLTIRRKYFFHRADNMRFYLNSKDERTLWEDYLLGARQATGCRLEALEPVATVDDPESNVLETIERYQIVDLVESHPGRYLQLTTEFVNDFPTKLDDSFPLQLGMDGALKHAIKVTTGRAPKIDVSEQSISNEWFEYKDAVSRQGKTLLFATELKPKALFVPAERMQAYMDDVETVRFRSGNHFAYNYPGFFTLDQTTVSGSSFRTLGLAAGVVLALYLMLQF
ncbi:MAG: DUF3857 domain-containing transglutaminase family protein [Gammaproteobacteria bacterium]